MKTSVEVIDAARAALGGASQYRLAKRCGVSSQYINDVVHGRSNIGDGLAEKLAAIIGCEPALIMAVSASERARTPEMRASWRRLAERAGAAVLACAFVSSGMVAGSDARADPRAPFDPARARAALSPVYALCELTDALTDAQAAACRGQVGRVVAGLDREHAPAMASRPQTCPPASAAAGWPVRDDAFAGVAGMTSNQHYNHCIAYYSETN